LRAQIIAKSDMNRALIMKNCNWILHVFQTVLSLVIFAKHLVIMHLNQLWNRLPWE